MSVNRWLVLHLGAESPDDPVLTVLDFERATTDGAAVDLDLNVGDRRAPFLPEPSVAQISQVEGDFIPLSPSVSSADESLRSERPGSSS
ncbi:hypothetical protein KEM52_003084, partial [Ascosphaera acerosa]